MVPWGVLVWSPHSRRQGQWTGGWKSVPATSHDSCPSQAWNQCCSYTCWSCKPGSFLFFEANCRSKFFPLQLQRGLTGVPWYTESQRAPKEPAEISSRTPPRPLLSLTSAPCYSSEPHAALEESSSSNPGGPAGAATLLEAPALYSRLLFIQCPLEASDYAQNVTCSLAQGAVPWRTSKIRACGNGGGLAFLLEDYKTVSMPGALGGGSSDSKLGQGCLRQRQAMRKHGQHTSLTPRSLRPTCHPPAVIPEGVTAFHLGSRARGAQPCFPPSSIWGRHRLIREQDKHPGNWGMGRLG